MLNWFIEDINETYPKLRKDKILKIFCSMKLRNKKYWVFGIGKRDWDKFCISQRQMQYFINMMIDYWFLSTSRKVRWSSWYICRVYKASKELLGYFTQIKDVVLVKCSNLTQRIKDFNNTNTFSSMFKVEVRGNVRFIKEWWVKYKIWRGVYEGKVYDSINNTWYNLFDFINFIWDNNIIKTCIKLKIVW